MEAQQFTLKHSIQPYIIVGGIFGLTIIGALILGLFGGIWDGFWGMLGVTAVYLFVIYSYDLRYSISFKDKSITMHVATWQTSPAALTTIRVVDITSIKRETSDFQTIIAQQRVIQRIAIY